MSHISGVRASAARDTSASSHETVSGGVGVEISAVAHSFVSDDRVVDALVDIDLAIGAGEFVSLVGPRAAARPRCSTWWRAS
ncbi:hypothetical protein [Nocardioides humi]|uniref:hypothetical protein n=1 Tax=Nocardioides humi TaxID=449461 RepID=UPI00112D5CC0|nr:hypothetical protein [Nocardioides humi]